MANTYDLHQPITFGGNVDPTAADPRWPFQLAQVIEEVGLEYIGIQDHPYNSKFLDTWTLLAALTQATQRVRFFPNVTNLPLRPPAMLAKAAATLDLVSGGRMELGLGAGAFWEPIAAMGGPKRSPGEAVSALEEAIQIIRAFWEGTHGIRFAGTHYQVLGARPGPQPAHAMGIWLGAYGPRMLGLTGRMADGWIPSLNYAPPSRIPEMQQRINDAAEAAGRNPETIRRIYNIMGQITEGTTAKLIRGPVSHWIEELTRFAVELGMDTFIFWPDEDHIRQFQRFAAEVVPGVRDAVAQARPSA